MRIRYAEGASARSLAKDYDCPPARIAKLVAGINQPSPLDSIDQEEVRRLYLQGVIIRDLAAKFGCSRRRVSAVLGDLVRSKGRPQLNEDQKEEVRQAYAHKESIHSIARRFEVDRRTVYRLLDLGEMRTIRDPCPSTFAFDGKTHSCHLTTHEKGTHRTKWFDGETQFRVEWQ